MAKLEIAPPPRNPLAFPAGRQPRFDASHPAAKGIIGNHGYSCVASGSNGINLVTGGVLTSSGAEGFSAQNTIFGPGAKPTGGDCILTTPAVSKTDTNQTLATILYTPASLTEADCCDSGSTGAGAVLVQQSTGALICLIDFTAITTTMTPLVANTPYFLACSFNGTSVNFLVRNLLNGQLFTETDSQGSNSPGASGTTYGAFAGTVEAAAQAPIMATMFAPSYLTMPQLRAWAVDPWAFWYPHQFIPAFKSAAAVTSFLMSVGAGYYSLTDEQETLLKASLATIYDGTYALTEENLQTLKGSKSSVYTGYYSLTDEQLTLLKASQQYPQAGYYSLTGEQVTETAARKATVQTGYYNLTEEQLALLFGHKATVQTGYYSLTEEQLTLLNAHSQTIQTGYYSVVGEQLTLTFSGATGFVMAIGAGNYSVSGENQGQVKKSIAALSTTFYTLAEENLQTLKGSKIGAQTGYYTFTVENEELLYGREATIQSGSYTLTGEQVTEIAAHFSKLGAGVYSMTGEAVITIAGLRVTIKAAPMLLGADIKPNLVGNESPIDLLGADIVPGLKGQVT